MAEYLKLPDVARRLDVSEKTARRYVKSGELPSVFIGGAYRVSDDDLEAFLSRAKVSPGVGYPKGERRSSYEPSLFNGALEEERRLEEDRRVAYLRAWRAFVHKLVHRWEATPPETASEVSVVLDAMQALIGEGTLERPSTEITTSDKHEASEWMELSLLFRGIDRLNQLADAVQEDAEAKRRRETFTVIQNRMAG